MNDFRTPLKVGKLSDKQAKIFRVATILLYTAKQFFVLVYTTLPVRPGSSYLFNPARRDQIPLKLNHIMQSD